MSDRRGLVVSGPVTVDASGGLLAEGKGLDPQELRFSLLLWDVIEYPGNRFIYLVSTPDEQFLEQAGVMQRTSMTLNIQGSFRAGEIFRAAHVATFRYVDSREPGVWSLSTSDSAVSFDNTDLDFGRGLLVQLHRAIPVPDKTVALQDILEFRERRRPELLALRSHLEGIYARVKSGSDDPILWNMELSALNRSLEDHLKASREWGVKLRWTSFEAGLNLPAGVTAGVTAASQGLPLLGSLATGFAASLALRGGPSLRGREVTKTPFRYVSRFHDELFV